MDGKKKKPLKIIFKSTKPKAGVKSAALPSDEFNSSLLRRTKKEYSIVKSDLIGHTSFQALHSCSFNQNFQGSTTTQIGGREAYASLCCVDDVPIAAGELTAIFWAANCLRAACAKMCPSLSAASAFAGPLGLMGQILLSGPTRHGGRPCALPWAPLLLLQAYQ